jgi:hypothetical protein
MYRIRKYPLQPGLNHLQVPLAAVPVGVGYDNDIGIQAWLVELAIPPTLESRTFLLVSHQDFDHPPLGKCWRLIGAQAPFFVFELCEPKARGYHDIQTGGPT